jgi:hypothetical protein
MIGRHRQYVLSSLDYLWVLLPQLSPTQHKLVCAIGVSAGVSPSGLLRTTSAFGVAS